MLKKRNIDILNHMYKDCRTSLGQISNKTDVPVSSVFDIIKDIEDKKIVKKWCVMLNPSYLRFPLRIFFFAKLRNVFDDYRINNMMRLDKKGEYFIEVYLRDLSDLIEFKKNIRKHGKIVKSFEINTILKENGLKI